MSAWKHDIEEILDSCRTVGQEILHDVCKCPDEAHQNRLHDIAADLPDALTTDRKEQRASALELVADEAHDVVTDLINAAHDPGDYWQATQSVLLNYLHGAAAEERGDADA